MMVAHDTCVIVCWQTAVVLVVPEVVGLGSLCVRANKVVRDRTEHSVLGTVGEKVLLGHMLSIYVLSHPK